MLHTTWHHPFCNADTHTFTDAADLSALFRREQFRMSNERIAFLRDARQQGCSPLTAVRKVRDERLFEAGEEFNVAMDFRAIYGLTTHQLHDIVGWLRGRVSDDDLEGSLPG